MPNNNNSRVRLPTAEIANFENQRSSAQSAFARGDQQLNLQRRRYEVDFGRTFGGRDLGDGLFQRTQDTFRQRRNQLANPYLGRGLINSGIFKEAVNRHFTEKGRAISDLELQFSRRQADFDLAGTSLEDALNEALTGIQMNQQLRESVYAEMIRNGNN